MSTRSSRTGRVSIRSPSYDGEKQYSRGTSTASTSFNPLPVLRRGETRRGDLRRRLSQVSIRSPSYDGEKRSVLIRPHRLTMFQSAPRLTTGRNEYPLPAYAPQVGFNPLPVLRRGETVVANLNARQNIVSIRSPSYDGEKPRARIQTSDGLLVSIRSPSYDGEKPSPCNCNGFFMLESRIREPMRSDQLRNRNLFTCAAITRWSLTVCNRARIPPT